MTPDASAAIVSGMTLRGRGQPVRRSLYALDLKSERKPWEAELPDAFAKAAAVSPDGRVLAAYVADLSATGSSTGAGSLRFWSIERGDELKRIDVDDADIRTLSFSHDGRRLISGMNQGDILVWDVSAIAVL
jgi:WD40 repeat protein